MIFDLNLGVYYLLHLSLHLLLLLRSEAYRYPFAVYELDLGGSDLLPICVQWS